jgi:hypothetical protein
MLRNPKFHYRVFKNLPLAWARWIQFTPSSPISLRPILILFSHQRRELPSGLLPFTFATKILYAKSIWKCWSHNAILAAVSSTYTYIITVTLLVTTFVYLKIGGRFTVHYFINCDFLGVRCINFYYEYRVVIQKKELQEKNNAVFLIFGSACYQFRPTPTEIR